jgi:hypothetical protein
MFIIFFMNAVVQSIFPMLNEGLAPVYLICVMFALVSYALNHFTPALLLLYYQKGWLMSTSSAPCFP